MTRKDEQGEGAGPSGRIAIRLIHVSAVPENVPRPGPKVAARLPRRSFRATRLALGRVDDGPRTVLVLMAEARIEAEFHESTLFAMGQAELEFGVSPDEWDAAAPGSVVTVDVIRKGR